MENFTPKTVASFISKTANIFLDKVSQAFDRHLILKGLFLTLVLVGSVHTFFHWSDYYTIFFGDEGTHFFLVDRLILDFPYYIIIGVVLGVAGFILPPKVLPDLHIIGFILCLGVISTSHLETPIPYNMINFTINIVGTYVLYFLGFYLPRHKGLRIQLWSIYGACIGSLFLNSVTLLIAPSFKFFWYIQSIRLIFIFSTLVQERYHRLLDFKSNSEYLSYVFSPSVFLTPLPVPSKEWKFSQSTKVRLVGFSNLIINIAYVAAAVALKIWVIIPMEPKTFLSYIAYGFFKYIFYYLASCAWIEIPVSLCQWMGGMPLISGFDFPLLAPNPFERWRTWNTYYYRWFGWNIFIPVQKKTKSSFLSVALVFLFTMFIHSGRDNIYLFTFSNKIFASKLLITQIVFFSLHGLLVYVALKTPRLWGQANKVSGWWGVFIMTFLMSLVHIIAL